MKVLSIRQPWAWLIVNGHKDVENRSWYGHHRGPLMIHAGKGMTRDEYDDAREVAGRLFVTIPGFGELERGGIVGVADMVDCVSACDSPWFFGRYGFLFRNAKPIPFHPIRGHLGFFDVQIEDAPCQ